MTEIVVAVFRTGEDAEAAMRDLESAGIPSDGIRRHRRDGDIGQSTTGSGLAQWLRSNDSAAGYDRALDAGGTVLALPVEEAHAERVIAILHEHSPLDIEERPDTGGGASAPAKDVTGRVRRFQLDDDTGRVW
ncbi:MAG: hypothetical protein JO326_06300 [Acetobacteraceae bacterium]|nr:hypothetical protein [Acetobacteraceae bacterium]